MKSSLSQPIIIGFCLIIYLLAAYTLYFLFRDQVLAERFFDSAEIVISFSAGIFILRKGLKKGLFNAVAYIGYACLLWSFGELFWFMYVLTGREGLPFPSVAELAFLGTHFFLISSLKEQGHKPDKKSYLAFIVPGLLLIPIIGSVLLSGHLFTFIGIYSILYVFVVAWAVFLAFSKVGIPLWLKGAVFILGLADLIMILQINRGDTLIVLFSDPLYPLFFLILILGVRRTC